MGQSCFSAELPDWLGEATRHGTYGIPSTNALMEAINWIGRNLQHPTRLNEFLRACPICQLHQDYLITLIRLPYASRAKLPEWTSMVERVRDELIKRGIPRDQVRLKLMGLVDDALNVKN